MRNDSKQSHVLSDEEIAEMESAFQDEHPRGGLVSNTILRLIATCRHYQAQAEAERARADKLLEYCHLKDEQLRRRHQRVVYLGLEVLKANQRAGKWKGQVMPLRRKLAACQYPDSPVAQRLAMQEQPPQEAGLEQKPKETRPEPSTHVWEFRRPGDTGAS